MGGQFKVALSRRWILLIKEPIVLLLTIYMAVIYGTLYMMFGAFPIVFQKTRGLEPRCGGIYHSSPSRPGWCLPWRILFMTTSDINGRKHLPKLTESSEPRRRLASPRASSEASAFPIGLFIFAWTNYPSVHWIVCVLAAAPFGAGMVMVFLSVFNYLIWSMHTPSTPRASWPRTAFCEACSVPRFRCSRTRCTPIWESMWPARSPPSWHWSAFSFPSCSIATDPPFGGGADMQGRPRTRGTKLLNAKLHSSEKLTQRGMQPENNTVDNRKVKQDVEKGMIMTKST